jgi:hypothetical protein
MPGFPSSVPQDEFGNPLPQPAAPTHPDLVVRDSSGTVSSGGVGPGESYSVTDGAGNVQQYKNPDAAPASAAPPPMSSPLTLDQFIPSEGGGLGMGHFANQEDLQTHRDALNAARAFAGHTKNAYDMNNEAQGHLDTAAAHTALAGIDFSDPEKAMRAVEAIRAKNTYAAPEAFGFADKMIAARQGFLGKQSLQGQREDARNTAADSLEKIYHITPSELLHPAGLGAGEMVHSEVTDPKTKVVSQKTEFVPSEKGSVYRFYDGTGKTVFMSKDEYQNHKDALLLNPTGKTAPAAKPKTDAEVAARIGVTAPAPGTNVAAPAVSHTVTAPDAGNAEESDAESEQRARHQATIKRLLPP